MMTMLRGRRGVWRVVSAAIILAFLGGCYLAISNLMRIDSSREAEVAKNIVKKIQKEPQVQKEPHSQRGDDVIKEADGKIAVQDYDAREHAVEQDNKVEQKAANQNKEKLKLDLEGFASRNRSIGANADSKIMQARKTVEDGKVKKRKDDSKVQVEAEGNSADDATWPVPNYNLHAFYYPWYGNPESDGQYLHWNHPRLPHWNKAEAKKWPSGRWKPPDEIGANFYPKLGCYSSRNPAVIEDHMKQLRLAGIGVLSISWYPAGLADDQGKPSDDLIPTYLDMAQKYNLKVTFHSEPYKGRSEVTFHNDVKYIIDHYGGHPAFYRFKLKDRDLPMFYVYDSYLTNATKWARLFGAQGDMSVRNSKYDGVFLGLYVETKHKNEILAGRFDGFYTYFASNGFSYGSRWQNWKLLADFSRKRGLVFVPSVGPGYVDTRVRPWNKVNTKHRDNGKYYDRSFESAVDVKPRVISITSFNEWHEGSQIERAVPKAVGNFTYMNYGKEGPDKYLLQTQKWSKVFQPGQK